MYILCRMMRGEEASEESLKLADVSSWGLSKEADI